MSETTPQFKDPRTAELTRRISMIDAQIFDDEMDMDADRTTLAKIGESRFIRDFLAVLAGVVTTDVEGALLAWDAIAGGSFKRVLLVDENGKGVRIVPARKSSDLFPIGERKFNIRDMVDHAHRAANIPGGADSLIESELKSVFTLGQDEESNEILKQQWETFLAHYGFVTGKANAKPGVTPGYENVEVVYD